MNDEIVYHMSSGVRDFEIRAFRPYDKTRWRVSVGYKTSGNDGYYCSPYIYPEHFGSRQAALDSGIFHAKCFKLVPGEQRINDAPLHTPVLEKSKSSLLVFGTGLLKILVAFLPFVVFGVLFWFKWGRRILGIGVIALTLLAGFLLGKRSYTLFHTNQHNETDWGAILASCIVGFSATVALRLLFSREIVSAIDWAGHALYTEQ